MSRSTSSSTTKESSLSHTPTATTLATTSATTAQSPSTLPQNLGSSTDVSLASVIARLTTSGSMWLRLSASCVESPLLSTMKKPTTIQSWRMRIVSYPHHQQASRGNQPPGSASATRSKSRQRKRRRFVFGSRPLQPSLASCVLTKTRGSHCCQRTTARKLTNHARTTPQRPSSQTTTARRPYMVLIISTVLAWT